VSLSIHAVEDTIGYPAIGFGVKRLKDQGHKLKNMISGNGATSCDNVVQLWYSGAIIDNFAAVESQQKWYGLGQRYWINKQFWGGVGFPIFVFIGGEGSESCTRLTSKMYIYDLAEKHQALLVDLEHRFYGQSFPYMDMSTDSLQYLSADQALADLARFIGFLKQDLSTLSSKVVTVGGSYPGNLAAWFRLKYPSVTAGSIASSAPVTAQTNFKEYMDVVGQSLIHFSGQKCFDAFTLAAEIIANLALQGLGSGGMNLLQNDFNTCSPITSDLDLAVLLSDLMGNVQGTVQYNNEHTNVMNITDICSVMTATSDSYSQFVALQALYRTANGQTCEDASWADTVAYLAATQNDPTNNARPWTYQTCNEFGYFQTADSKNQPFKSWKWLDLDFSRAICFAAFDGWKSDPQVDWVNQKFGDVHIAGTNIVFPSGTIDPWHALGVTNSSSVLLPQRSEQAVFIEGTAHCNDLYAANADTDPVSLSLARETIAKQLNSWLK